MEKKLQKELDALETQRIQLIQFISRFSDSDLNQVPEPGKWSANQIICHLILAEELSYKSIKYKIVTSSNFEKSGIMNQVRVLLLRFFLRSSKKFKAPAAVSVLPEKSELSKLLIKWDQSRILFKELLDSIPSNLLNKYIFKHPVAGKMTIYGGLSFMQEHIRRHQQQIKNILST